MSNNVEYRLFTRAEIQNRNTRQDAVLIIHNKVYNLTNFLQEHPGGEEVLLEKAGQDASEQFDDIGHSADARALMKKYEIGELAKSEQSNPIDINAKPESCVIN